MPRYRIVPDQSRLWIEGRSSVHPIHTTTDGLEGYVDLILGDDGTVDASEGPSGKLSLPVERLSSGNRTEDRELYRRIDVRRYPTIEGILHEIKPSEKDGSYRVAGEVKFRGTSRQHEDEMTIRAVDDQTIELAGSSHFDIRDFGMEPPRILMLKVEPEVEVRVDIKAVKEG